MKNADKLALFAAASLTAALQAGHAFAQDATPTEPPAKVEVKVKTISADATSTSYASNGEVKAVATESTASATAIVPVAAQETVVVTTRPGVRAYRVDEGKRDEFGRKRNWGPALDLGLQGGVTYWVEGTPFFGTDVGVGKALTAGPNFGLRASLEFFSWLALDGRVLFTSNKGNDLVQGGTLDTVGGLGAIRLTLPFFRVRPYAFVGVGGHGIYASGKYTQLIDGHVPAIEGGLGAIVPVGYHFDVGAEYAYSHFIGEVLSTHEEGGLDGGDPTNFSLFVQYHFEL